MCQAPRHTSKYRDWWSYRQFSGSENDKSKSSEKTGCEQTLAFAIHKGPMIFQECINFLNDKPHIWYKTKEYPDLYIPWRVSKNLSIYNETSFY